MDPAMNFRIIIVQAAVSVFTENSDFLKRYLLFDLK